MRCEPLRREAWSIFNQKDPRVKVEKGEGHNFTSRKVRQDWCDACNRHIKSAAFKCQRHTERKEEKREREIVVFVEGQSIGPNLIRPSGQQGCRVAERQGRGGVHSTTQNRAQPCDGGRTGATGEESPHLNATEPQAPRPTGSRSRTGTWSGTQWWNSGQGRNRPEIATIMLPETEEAVASACFGQVSKRLGRFFRRLPKSRSWSEGLRILRRSSSSGTLELSDCSYTCHLECQGLVQLDCNQLDHQADNVSTTTSHGPIATNHQETIGGLVMFVSISAVNLKSALSHHWSLEWCIWSPKAYLRVDTESLKLDPTPQMTGSNSMSSGYCSLDEESDDFTFFTAKTSFFRQPQAKPVVKNVALATEEAGENVTSLTGEEIKAKIDDYNSNVTENGMKLGSDGSYTGFIKVHLKLRRPVTVLSVDGKSPGQSSSSDSSDKRISFYLPSETVKQLHISSTTTVREVIQGLLKKFMVQDNPSKFALYRLTRRDSQDLFEKLPISDCPLYLRLLAGPELENLTFVLKENETGEVEWHAFSVPELQNFLIILEKEENERVRLVEQRYSSYRERLQQALCKVQGKPV
ncbi:Ras association domain-containing protein 5 [Triplophysa tibetana]|uniref:Ras association domain-containing protein 5 n=1 Tax=Triplophysa tibetana TaxID=1572043 RepID=A0A5A9NF90_9TELE|nr:Ras association domain-containing protein 5 [Triplophysa tibetana]